MVCIVCRSDCFRLTFVMRIKAMSDDLQWFKIQFCSEGGKQHLTCALNGFVCGAMYLNESVWVSPFYAPYLLQASASVWRWNSIGDDWYSVINPVNRWQSSSCSILLSKWKVHTCSIWTVSHMTPLLQSVHFTFLMCLKSSWTLNRTAWIPHRNELDSLSGSAWWIVGSGWQKCQFDIILMILVQRGINALCVL